MVDLDFQRKFFFARYCWRHRRETVPSVLEARKRGRKAPPQNWEQLWQETHGMPLPGKMDR